MPYIGTALPDILCEHFERTVGNNNCVSFEGMSLQIPPDELRHHYVKRRVRVHRYVDATLAVFYGPRSWPAMMSTAHGSNPCANWPPDPSNGRPRPAARRLQAAPYAVLPPDNQADISRAIKPDISIRSRHGVQRFVGAG